MKDCPVSTALPEYSLDQSHSGLAHWVEMLGSEGAGHSWRRELSSLKGCGAGALRAQVGGPAEPCGGL